MKNLSVMLFILMLFSCNDKKISEKAESKKVKIPAKTSMGAIKAPPVYIDSAATENQILAHLAQRKKDITELLKTATPEQADQFYEDYKKEDDSAISILIGRKSKLLDDYASFFTYDEKTGKNPLVIPKNRQSEIKNIEKTDVEFWYVGEGYTELRRKPDFYYTMFKGKVSPDYQRWIELQKEEDRELYAADAGIIVPWKDIGDRILARENFLKDFPNSKLSKDIKGQLKIYRWDYFAGQENTPVFYDSDGDGGGRKIDTDIYKEYQRFMKANPTSETTKILTQLLKNQSSYDKWNAKLEQLLGKRFD